jgi:hypothetical protein
MTELFSLLQSVMYLYRGYKVFLRGMSFGSNCQLIKDNIL